MATSNTSIHLLVLIHGMWGNPNHLSELARIIQETKGETEENGVKLHILIAETNREESTYDGIDYGGERVAKEVLDEARKLEKDGNIVTRFSVTGYSLGGLVARYLVGILHQRGFFEAVKPVNFNTLATPHIGIPRYPSLLSSLLSSLGPKLLSRTGEQFYCVDQWSATGRPLLVVMADPERIFFKALALFRHLRIYANAVNDSTVPYVTSAIEVDDPFAGHLTNGISIELHSKHHQPLIKKYSLPENPPVSRPKPMVLSPRWFRSKKPSRPLLPPALQLRFPLNIILYGLLPLLIPVGISFALFRLSMSARSSRRRIKLLESDDANREHLVRIIAELEKRVEDAVVDLIDEPDQTEPSSPRRLSPEHPIITPVQRRIVANLNKLPFEKELAFFPSLRNAHATIVCRDVKRFEAHRMGEGVLRHWAGSFIM